MQTYRATIEITRRGAERGFTLIELMIAVAVLAILLTVGVPSFKTVIDNNRLVTQANAMVTLMHVGRAEALKQGKSVGICSSDDPYNAPACDGGSNWDTGYIVFVADPSNSSSPLSYNAGTDTLIKVGLTESGITQRYTRESSAANTTVHYMPNGTLRTSSTIKIGICDYRGAADGRELVIRPMGRAKVLRPATDCTTPTF